jgi:hypothetical protein
MADTQRDDLQAEPSATGTSAAWTSAADDPSPEGGSEGADTELADSGAEPASPATAGTAAAPEPETAATPAHEPTPAGSPTLETTTTVPPLAAPPAGEPGSEGEGGEWNLLVEKLQQWWASGELQKLWRQAKSPLTVALAVVAVVLVLRVYAGLLGAIHSLPLIPGLLELVGLVWAVRYGLPRLIRRSEREQLIDDLKRRWHSFSGRS